MKSRAVDTHLLCDLHLAIFSIYFKTLRKYKLKICWILQKSTTLRLSNYRRISIYIGTTSYLFISCISIPNIPIVKHKGINHFESALANSVSFIFLKNPTYLKSPMTLITKIEGIIQYP